MNGVFRGRAVIEGHYSVERVNTRSTEGGDGGVARTGVIKETDISQGTAETSVASALAKKVRITCD